MKAIIIYCIVIIFVVFCIATEPTHADTKAETVEAEIANEMGFSRRELEEWDQETEEIDQGLRPPRPQTSEPKPEPEPKTQGEVHVGTASSESKKPTPPKRPPNHSHHPKNERCHRPNPRRHRDGNPQLRIPRHQPPVCPTHRVPSKHPSLPTHKIR